MVDPIDPKGIKPLRPTRPVHRGAEEKRRRAERDKTAEQDGGRPRDPGRYEGIRLAQASPWRGSGSWSDVVSGSTASSRLKVSLPVLPAVVVSTTCLALKASTSACLRAPSSRRLRIRARSS